MRTVKLIIFILLDITTSLIHAQSSLKCEVIKSILNIEKINHDLNLDNIKSQFIRIVDPDKYFKRCNCEYKTNSIIFTNNVPLDFNTGRFIDLTFLKIIKKSKTITIHVYYALSGPMDRHSNLWSANIKMSLLNKKIIKIDELEFSNIQ